MLYLPAWQIFFHSRCRHRAQRREAPKYLHCTVPRRVGWAYYPIDFGFLSFFDVNEPYLFTKVVSASGNRLFMSVLSYIGFSALNLRSHFFHILMLSRQLNLSAVILNR